MRTFRARREGRCGICDEPIAEGDEVRYEDDELVHADCLDEDEIAERYPDWQ